MLSPERLAGLFEEYMAAKHAAMPGTETFAAWLEAHWTVAEPVDLVDPPVAVSVLGSDPAILWYERGESIVGYPTTRPTGCYWVPRTASAPPLPAA